MKNTTDHKVLSAILLALLAVHGLTLLAKGATELKAEILHLIPEANAASWMDCAPDYVSKECQQFKVEMEEIYNAPAKSEKEYLDQNPITEEYANEQTNLWRQISAKITKVLVSLF